MRDDVESSERPDALARLLREGRLNAVVAWTLVAVVAVVFVESVFDRDLAWIVFVAGTALIVLIPPVAARSWWAMLPWELLALALAPILTRGLVGGEVGTVGVSLSVAGFALIVAVELRVFSSLRLTRWFAVVFVVCATLASAGAWAIVRWTLDRWIGTTLLADPAGSADAANDALMIEFLWVTLAGLGAGLLFEVYLSRRDRQLRRRIEAVIRR